MLRAPSKLSYRNKSFNIINLGRDRGICDIAHYLFSHYTSTPLVYYFLLTFSRNKSYIIIKLGRDRGNPIKLSCRNKSYITINPNK
jgi:hypothetical protein